MDNGKKNFNYILLKKIFSNKSQSHGFTLVELLVVAIIIGILAAIALPSLTSQIGKAREAEAKTNLGVIARAQQTYRYENKVFYSGTDISNFIEVGLSGEYYTYTADITATQAKAIHHAYTTNPQQTNARDFSTGIYFNEGLFSQTLCVATGVDNDGTSSSVTAGLDGTCLGGAVVK